MPNTLGKNEAVLEAANMLVGMGASQVFVLWLAGPRRIAAGFRHRYGCIGFAGQSLFFRGQ